MSHITETARPPGRRLNPAIARRRKRLVGQLIVGLVFLGIWQVVSELRFVDPLVARSPAQVWAILVEMVRSGLLWPSLYSTLEAIAITFVLAGGLGIVAGVGLGLFPKAEALLEPYLNAINAMPRIALAPVLLIYFGIDQGAKIALATSIVFFIVMVNARAGIRTVDRDCLVMARMMDSSRLQMFTKILLPTAVPSIFAGLRLAVIYSFLGVITSEILSSRLGLGQLIAMYAGIFRLEGMYAVVLIMALLATILNIGMNLIEKRLLRWKGEP
ncbi:ABC transporter permease [Devosia sp. YIM 151766]|uniref:ABC transporter permease n=1 Tax=Devosia sp. YIM 151766 TaxID=3017325 RepID=UPI00255CB930|nr:ABC transporter permease [Devosia sp. YIM 151766]WIY53903.1 ABC transporter permease [Devosia sp. YIM 151766]